MKTSMHASIVNREAKLFVVLAILGVICACTALAGTETSGGTISITNSLVDDLAQAISTNDAERVTAILKLQPTLASGSNHFHVPLIVQASGQTNLAIVTALLDAGAGVDATDWRRTTALRTTLDPILTFRGRFITNDADYVTARMARLAVASLLLERGASIYTPDEFGRTVLNDAVQMGDGELVDFLLLRQHPITVVDANGNSAVHLAAIWARTNALKKLAEMQVNLETTNHEGWTPLQNLSRLPPDTDMRYIIQFRGGWGPGLEVEGQKYRDLTARLLIELGAHADIFSATAFEWTNTVDELLAPNQDVVRQTNGSGQTALHWAAEFGRASIARQLLDSGAAADSADCQGRTPLDIAVEKGQISVAEVLIRHGASVIRTAGAKTPLHWAAEQGNLPLMELLLGAGADSNAQDEHEQTALDLAARNNHEQAERLLLARQANLKTGGYNLTTPLHWAAANGNTNVVDLLLAQGCDLNARNAEGKSALFLACERNDFTMLELLLARGADANGTDTNGNTALHMRATAETDRLGPPVDPFRRHSVQNTNPTPRSMMEFLIKHGAKVEARNLAGETPLHRVGWKTFDGSNAVDAAALWLKPLLTSHANIAATDTNGQSALHLAVKQRNLPVIEALFRAGGKVNARDNLGRTPLHLAMLDIDPFGKSMLVVELLLKGGCKVNAKDKAGATPLHLAVSNYVPLDTDRPIVSCLIRHGARVDAVDKQGRTPLQIAASSRYHHANEPLYLSRQPLIGKTKPFEVVVVGSEMLDEGCVLELLLNAGAHPDLCDRHGNTALHAAAAGARQDFVQLLLKHHANRSLRNRDGKTPLQIAYENAGGYQIIPLLEPPNVSGEIADAARRGDLSMVKAFLAANPSSANWPWLFGSTPLQWAANSGQTEIAKLLLEHGARLEPPKRATNEASPMIEYNSCLNNLAGESLRRDSSRIPSDPAETNEVYTTDFLTWFNVYSKQTPLELALAGGHRDTAKLLVKWGAKVDLPSAVELGLAGVLKNTIRADPGCVNSRSSRESWRYWPHAGGYTFGPGANAQNGTLLHFAVWGGQSTMIQLLLKSGANKAALDDEGRTAYQLALAIGQNGLAELLK